MNIKNTLNVMVIVCVSILCHCSFLGGSQITSRISTEDTIRIGVLDFSHQGSMGISGKLGEYAADRLTSSLFIKKNFEVVDRTMVKAEMVKSKLSPEILDSGQIRILGEAMNADYLIVGMIEELANPIEDMEEDKGWNLEISFRILDTRTGAVKGVVRTQEKGKGEKKVLLGKIIDRMAESVRIR